MFSDSGRSSTSQPSIGQQSSSDDDNHPQSSCENEHRRQQQDSHLENYLDQLIDEQITAGVREAIGYSPSPEGDFLEDSTTRSRLNAKQGYITCAIKQFIFPGSTISKYEISMSKLLTFLLLFWSILHTVRYALLSARSVTIREAPPPRPFFYRSNRYVHDFFDGSIDPPEVMGARAELSIVMLYAPWDTRSKEFRRPFHEAAFHFHQFSSLKFYAANCHYHRGSCRKMYKLLSFPVIFAHTPYGQPAVFNQILSSDRLFSWILHLLDPLSALQSVDDHHKLITGIDFSIIGHFALQRPQPLPRAFHVFLNAAYKASNSRSILAFGTVLNRNLADDLGFAEPNRLHFHCFYEAKPSQVVATMEIGTDTKSQQIIDWANEQLEKYGARAVYELELEDLESVSKSESLFHKLNASTDGTVVLFTNIHGTRAQTHSLIALKNLAKLFNHCPGLNNESEALPAPHQLLKATSLEEYFAEIRLANQSSADDPLLLYSANHSRSNLCQDKLETMLGKCCEQLKMEGKCHAKVKGGQEEMGDEDDPFDNERAAQSTSCFWPVISDQNLFKRRCCAATHRRNGKSKQPDGIGISTFNQLNWRQRMKCKFGEILRGQHPPHSLLQDDKTDYCFEGNSGTKTAEIDASLHGIIGAGCPHAGNKSIGFLTMDRRFGQHFMRTWGLDEQRMDTDSVAIVTRAKERIHWMEAGEIQLQSLAKFLTDFFNGTLSWAVKNELMVVDDEEEGQQSLEDYETDLHGYPMSTLGHLNRQMFLDQILNSTNRSVDSVVFFSGGDWHGPSRSVLHYLHQTKHYFQQFSEHIEFYILDTTKNSLPETHSLERLPSIAFFPAKRPYQHYVFPSDLAFTVPNLLAFLLPRCQDRLRWRLAFAICRAQCLERNFRKIGLTLRVINERIRALHIHRWLPVGKTQMPRVRLLRRYRLQKETLLRMRALLLSLHQKVELSSSETDNDDFMLEQQAVEEVELLTRLLYNKI